MFAGNMQSSWANNNNNNQQQGQQPATSAFGQPSGFGQSAFGGGGAFGQQQQQQQPAANPMFGAGNTGTTGAFGAFSTPQNNASTSAFGAPKPATGFGAFSGGTSTFGGGGTGAFGQNTTTATPSAFGNTTAGTSAFGSTANTGAFGQAKPTTAFGATAVGTDVTPPPVTTGSTNPPFAANAHHAEKDAGAMVQYQCITAVPAYRGTSIEEIRVQDYAQGRKTAGTGNSFGQTAFGGTGAFGQQPAQQTAFGQPAAAPAAGAFGAFGQPQQPATSAFGTSTGTGAFGQPAQQPAQPQQSVFGSFGQPAQQQPAQSTFGTSSAFGTAAPKPATAFGGFGTGATGTGAFGSTGNSSVFGQTAPQQQQQPAPGGGMFGNTSAITNSTGLNAFANAGKGTFGQTAAPATGAFGSNTGLFGNTQNQASQPAPTTTGTGIFGSFGQNTQQPQQQQQQQNTPSLFGNTGATQPTGTGTGLFGNGGGSNIFGQSNNNNQQQQAGANPLFGAKPAGQNNMFGSFGQTQQQQPAANNQSTGLFGSSMNQSTNTNNQSTGFGGSLFGNKSLAAPAQGQNNSMFGGSFNASASNAGAQGTLTASISQPIATTIPIFSLLADARQDPESDAKKLNFFVDVPTRLTPNRSSAINPAASLSGSKLRGFGSSPSLSDSAMKFSFTKGTPHGLSVTKTPDMRPTDSILGRSGSPALGSGSKKSVKKLIFDKKVEPTELFMKSGTPSPIRGGKVIFTPALSIAQREKEAEERAKAAQNLPPTPTPAPRQHSTPNRFTAEDDPTSLNEGDYWVKPEMSVLRNCGYDQISSFKDLVVGRIGYGEIHFLEPVDLTGLTKLGSLLGEVIRFDDKECSVYPDSDDVDKPPPGSGLNVRARIMLKRCWVADKATREPVKDEKHPMAVKHLRRLKGMRDTHFEGFDIKDGTWTFTVDHF